MRAAIVPEYPQAFFHPSSPKMEVLYQLTGHQYWVALADCKVVGTVGVILAGEYALLKSLFLAKEYRGSRLGVASRLTQIATKTAIAAGCRKMFLGTMAQFEAAQRFYEKEGYQRVSIDDLPPAFPHNDFDVVFFMKTLEAEITASQ